MAAEHKETAERFFRAVYSGDSETVSELAAENIVLSYPVIEQVYGTPALQGREALLVLVGRFGARWTDVRIRIHESIAEGDDVVLFWDYAARAATAAEDTPPAEREHAWGGITLYRFDEAGKIVLELGEESAPGPIARIAGARRALDDGAAER